MIQTSVSLKARLSLATVTLTLQGFGSFANSCASSTAKIGPNGPVCAFGDWLHIGACAIRRGMGFSPGVNNGTGGAATLTMTGRPGKTSLAYQPTPIKSSADTNSMTIPSSPCPQCPALLAFTSVLNKYGVLNKWPMDTTPHARTIVVIATLRLDNALGSLNQVTK